MKENVVKICGISYEITSQLKTSYKSGPQKTTFLAKLETGEKYVISQWHCKIEEDVCAVRNFLDKWQTLAEIDGTAVAKYLGKDEKKTGNDTIIRLVVPYYEYTDDDYLIQDLPFIIYGINGLLKMHENGIVHGDTCDFVNFLWNNKSKDEASGYWIDFDNSGKAEEKTILEEDDGDGKVVTKLRLEELELIRTTISALENMKNNSSQSISKEIENTIESLDHLYEDNKNNDNKIFLLEKVLSRLSDLNIKNHSALKASDDSVGPSATRSSNTNTEQERPAQNAGKGGNKRRESLNHQTPADGNRPLKKRQCEVSDDSVSPSAARSSNTETDRARLAVTSQLLPQWHTSLSTEVAQNTEKGGYKRREPPMHHTPVDGNRLVKKKAR